MARTPQWIKNLGGHAGELYVCAELSKRGIPNAQLPQNFSDDDILVGKKAGQKLAYIQVKSCHPDRSSTFPLYEKHEQWANAARNQYVAFVWLGSPKRNEAPRFWIAPKREVGRACIEHPCHGTSNKERRFSFRKLKAEWENDWSVFDPYS